MLQSTNFKNPKIKIGTILFLDGYQSYKGSKANEHIVYDIVRDKWGTHYHTVERTTLELKTYQGPRPYSQKFGIGMYFEDDYNFPGSTNELSILVANAKAQKEEEERIAQEKYESFKKEQAEKLEKGKKLLTIPDWAKAVIVAVKYEDDSDAYTDYYNAKKTDMVYLGFSKSTRNNMKELKKASLLFDETKDFANDTSVEEVTNNYGYNLPTYFYGSDSYNGWKITKQKHINQEELYIAMAEGKVFLPTNEKEVEKSITLKNINPEAFMLIDYSEKAIALIGDTKAIKDQLKSLGGRFNPKLACGPGWIFPKTKESLLKQAIKI